MLKIIILTSFILISQHSCGQVPENRPPVLDKEFDQKISNLINFSVPLIGVQELKNIQNEVHIFDAREKEEFEVSHIQGARYLGYQEFDKERLAGVSSSDTIVLYCSIGYRSEKIGERLRELGYANVYNLYGSIFEWVNQGNEVVDYKGRPTSKVHTYNRSWSKWIDGQRAEKVW